MANYQSSYTGANIDSILGQVRQILFFQNVQVPTSSWEADSSYESFGYKADIALTGCTPDYYPDVVFNIDDAISGLFAPIAITNNGSLRIFANDIPENTIVIPTIKLTAST